MIEIVVATDLNNGIGRNNELLCTLRDDMKHFVELTTGNFVVMGRKTYESIGKPLPNRFNIILSRNASNALYGENIIFARSEDEIFKLNQMYMSKRIFIIGGAEIYKKFIPYANKIHLTRIFHKFEDADTFIPDIDIENDWKVVKEEHYEKDGNNEYPFSISVLERR